MDKPSSTPPRVSVLALRNRAGEVVAHSLIDSADAETVAQFSWCLNTNGYVWRSIEGGTKHVYLHRSLMGCVAGDGMYVDHRNRDRLDNRRANLRVVTPAEGAQNKPSLRGRFRGVSWDSNRGRWIAHAQLDRKVYHLGRFDSEEKAAEVAAAWRRDHMPFSEEAS